MRDWNPIRQTVIWSVPEGSVNQKSHFDRE
jgi:hypothetical protein